MIVTWGVLMFAVCTLGGNGKISSQTTYTNTTVPIADPHVNRSKELDAFLRLLYVADGHSDIPIFERGFDLTEEEQEKFKLWPEGEIPYFVDLLSFDLDQETKIIETFEKYNNLTGLNFYPLDKAPPEDDVWRWVLFANRRGQGPCETYTVHNFTNKGMQRVILGWFCIDMVHGLAPLVLALAGVPPQHNSPNRDEYIEILWDNIKPENRPLFKKLNDSDWLFHNMKYDFSSAGHFPSIYYSIDGNATFEIIKKEEDLDITDGTFHGLSYRDIKKIKMLYNYISSNRTHAMNLTRRSNNYDIDIADDGLPRPKPNRYLGLPEPVTTTTTTSTEPTTHFGRRRNKKRYRIKLPKVNFDDFLLPLR